MLSFWITVDAVFEVSFTDFDDDDVEDVDEDDDVEPEDDDDNICTSAFDFDGILTTLLEDFCNFSCCSGIGDGFGVSCWIGTTGACLLLLLPLYEWIILFLICNNDEVEAVFSLFLLFCCCLTIFSTI